MRMLSYNANLSRLLLAMTAMIAMVLLVGCEPSGPAPVKDFTIVHPDPTGESLTDFLKAEAEKASALNRKPFVDFTATWCPPCQAIEDNMNSRRMVEAFAGTYIIKIDVDDWRDEINDSPFRPESIPVFYEISSQGQPTGRTLTGAAFTSLRPRGMAPAFQKFFNAPSADSPTVPAS